MTKRASKKKPTPITRAVLVVTIVQPDPEKSKVVADVHFMSAEGRVFQNEALKKISALLDNMSAR